MKRILMVILSLVMIITLIGCSEADVVNSNISKEADQFNVSRRIVFFNGITDKYLLSIEGLCSLDVTDESTLRVTCKVGDEEYKRHYLGLSDNVSYFVEQVEVADVDPFRYKVIFKPESIIPDIDIETSSAQQ